MSFMFKVRALLSNNLVMELETRVDDAEQAKQLSDIFLDAVRNMEKKASEP